MAGRYLIKTREAAAVRVQMSHMRQSWGAAAAIWRAQTQKRRSSLVGGWGRKSEVCSAGHRGGERRGSREAESRRAACSGHVGGGQLEDTRHQWGWQRWLEKDAGDFAVLLLAVYYYWQ
jgi:hypothetical protein